MNKTLILIPPSEGKTIGGINPPIKEVTPTTKFLLKELNNYPNQEKLLGVKGTRLQSEIQINKSVLQANTKDAIHRYSGVVYNGINYDTLNDEEKLRFDERVRIVSALFGLVKPTQLIPNYKLKIDKLNAAKCWLPIISEEIKDHFIIDLLPKAHRKAVRYNKGLEVEFVIEKQGKRVPAGHNGKFIKGKFIRWLIQNNITNPEDFNSFNEDNFKWNGEFFLKKI